MQINYAKQEVSCKIVYYGPGMSGKTTNLEIIHQKVPEDNKGQMTSIATEGDRTLFFDFLPLDLGNVRGMTTKFQLYTVPGQVYYASTRKLVLQGADGVIFVADSQADKLAENIESFEDLKENLSESRIDIEEIPFVMQWNKRDLPGAMPIEELEEKVNLINAPSVSAVAATGEGVLETLKMIASLVLERLNSSDKAEQPAAKPAPAQAPKKTDHGADEYIAKVNNDSISKAYFNQYCQVQYRLGVKNDAVSDFKKFTLEEKKRLLDSLINYVLLLQDAKSRGLKADRSEVSAQLSSFSNKFRAREELDKFLETRNLTMDNLRNEAIKNIIIGKIIHDVIPDVQQRVRISENEMRDHYNENKNKYGDKPLDQVKRDVASYLKAIKKRALLNEFYSKLRSRASIEVREDKL